LHLATSRPSPPRTGHPADANAASHHPGASPGGAGRGGDAVSRRLGLLTDELDHCEREDEAECDEQDVDAAGSVEKDEHEHGEPDGGPPQQATVGVDPRPDRT
jgi:hypothetical protein